MIRPRQIALMLVAVLVLLGVIAVLGNRSGSTKALAQYQSQLRASGEKLTFAELAISNPPPPTTELAAFTNAVAVLTGSGVVPGAIKMRSYVGPGIAAVSWLQEPIGLDAVTQAKGSFWERFAAAEAGLQKPLAEIRGMLQQPPATSINYTGSYDYNHVGYLVPMRTAAQWFAGLALLEVRRGNLSRAADNLEAVSHLAQINRNEYLLVPQLIRNAICSLGTTATWEALQANGWSEPELRRLQEAWEAAELFPGLERAYLGERAFCEQMYQELRLPARRRTTSSGRPPVSSAENFLSEGFMLPLFRLTVLDENELLQLKTVQASIEAVRQLEQGASWSQARQPVDLIASEVDRHTNSLMKLRYFMALIGAVHRLPSLRNAVHAETERRLLITAIALKRYRGVNGKMAPDLSVLVPDFFKEIPIDPMSGKPFVYRSTTLENFLLYSLGDNGIDDEGSAVPTFTISFGFWEGLDAVWPTAAPAPK